MSTSTNILRELGTERGIPAKFTGASHSELQQWRTKQAALDEQHVAPFIARMQAMEKSSDHSGQAVATLQAEYRVMIRELEFEKRQLDAKMKLPNITPLDKALLTRTSNYVGNVLHIFQNNCEQEGQLFEGARGKPLDTLTTQIHSNKNYQQLEAFVARKSDEIQKLEASIAELKTAIEDGSAKSSLFSKSPEKELKEKEELLGDFKAKLKTVSGLLQNVHAILSGYESPTGTRNYSGARDAVSQEVASTANKHSLDRASALSAVSKSGTQKAIDALAKDVAALTAPSPGPSASSQQMSSQSRTPSPAAPQSSSHMTPSRGS